ncbi:SPOR domain-containing protein [bacterium]|nr:SPOR domain-containing protein [bacterium]
MSKLVLALATFALAAIAAEKTPVDLIRDGRVSEARRIIEQTKAPERYTLLLDALNEPNAIEACFLYREISSRFPGTDCDEFAQERLLQAAELGIDISALVLEQPDMPDSDFDQSHHYEVERPLAVSTTVPEELKAPFPVSTEPVDEAAPEPEVEKPIERLPIASTSAPAPQAQPVVVPAEEKKTESPVETEPETPASPTAGVTLDYGSISKNDTSVRQAAMTPDQSMVREEEPRTEQIEKQESLQAGVTPVEEEIEIPHDTEPNGGEWYIQVGAFGSLANADRIAAKLRSAGYRVVLVPFDEGGRHLMQVRVGGYSSKGESRKIGDEIHAKFNVPAVLVTQ